MNPLKLLESRPVCGPYEMIFYSTKEGHTSTRISLRDDRVILSRDGEALANARVHHAHTPYRVHRWARRANIRHVLQVNVPWDMHGLRCDRNVPEAMLHRR